MVDVEKKIEQQAEKTELSESELRDSYEQVKSKIDDNFPNKSDGFRERSAVRKMVEYAQGIENLEEKEIRIIAIGQKRDTIERKRQEAKEMFESSPQKAIDNGYTNRSGEPLWRSGPNSGQKMPKHLWRQNAFGVDSDGDFCQLACTQDQLFDKMDKAKEYSKVKGKFNDRSDFGDRVREYRLSRYTDLEVEEDAIDSSKAVELLEDSDVYEYIYDVREITEKLEYPEVATLVTVDFYEQKIPEDRNRRIRFSSFDTEISLSGFLPDEMDLDFENGSEVYVLGSTKIGDQWRDDMKRDPLQLATIHKIIPDPEGTLEEGEELPDIV